MNGPFLVCAGCGAPTTMFKPVCDVCLTLSRAAVPEQDHDSIWCDKYPRCGCFVGCYEQAVLRPSPSPAQPEGKK